MSKYTSENEVLYISDENNEPITKEDLRDTLVAASEEAIGIQILSMNIRENVNRKHFDEMGLLRLIELGTQSLLDRLATVIPEWKDEETGVRHE